MGIITRMRKQTAVYWAKPSDNRRGSRTFGTPVEIDCRWEDVRKLFVDDMGREITSKSIVYTDRVVEIDGWLYLGELDDLTTAQKADPQKVSNAGVIRAFDKLPNLGNRETLYTAVL